MGALLVNGTPFMQPAGPGGPLDRTVAWNYEKFNGLLQLPGNAPSADYPPRSPRVADVSAAGMSDMGLNQPGHYPAPGRVNQPDGQTYTAGPLSSLTNTLGGEPWITQGINKWKKEGTFTPANFPQRIQFRRGQGQQYKSALGAANTAQLADITNNPPQPDDLQKIIQGWG